MLREISSLYVHAVRLAYLASTQVGFTRRNHVEAFHAVLRVLTVVFGITIGLQTGAHDCVPPQQFFVR